MRLRGRRPGPGGSCAAGAAPAGAAGFWLFPKGWVSKVLILRFRSELRPPTTHQILVLRHAVAVR
eukprot:COSAG01_NODE_9115_length_2548_cov_2.696611_4_plen_64_part_01